MFQSSPDPRGPGVLRRRHLPCARNVSILARPSRAGRLQFPQLRAILIPFQSSPDPRGPGVQVFKPPTFQAQSFNPRPTLAGRASTTPRDLYLISKVSILARPSRAGRPDARCSWPRNGTSFNPRPTLAGRASMRIMESPSS